MGRNLYCTRVMQGQARSDSASPREGCIPLPTCDRTMAHMGPRPIRRLRRAELPLNTVKLARYLIGKTVVREIPGGRVAGRIVETEAYLKGDAASHFFRGPTPRNKSIYLAHGHAYVYFCYGVHFMLNVSAERAGAGGGVLIRALEPIEGIEWMEAKRGKMPLVDLARGPGRLAAAFGIARQHDGLDLCAANGELWLGAAVRPRGKIGTSVRIGITKDAHRMLRFYERRSPYVSGPKSLRQ
jgi:DNA-3-methyladenine glycosylase